MRKQAVGTGTPLGGVAKLIAAMVLCCAMPWGALAADLQTQHDRAILNAASGLTHLSKREKLFVHRCQIMRELLGFEDNPTGKAQAYSCSETGVGIAFYAGNDLGKHTPEKIARLFRDGLAEYKVPARVFIKRGHPHGSSMAFYINGESWLRAPVRPSKGYEMIEALAAETNLILLKRGRIDAWMTDPVSE